MPRKRTCKARLHTFKSYYGGPLWWATEDGCRHHGRVILDNLGNKYWGGRHHLEFFLRQLGYEVVGYGVKS